MCPLVYPGGISLCICVSDTDIVRLVPHPFCVSPLLVSLSFCFLLLAFSLFCVLSLVSLLSLLLPVHVCSSVGAGGALVCRTTSASEAAVFRINKGSDTTQIVNK